MSWSSSLTERETFKDLRSSRQLLSDIGFVISVIGSKSKMCVFSSLMRFQTCCGLLGGFFIILHNIN